VKRRKGDRKKGEMEEIMNPVASLTLSFFPFSFLLSSLLPFLLL
jgi:hypothetical protein